MQNSKFSVVASIAYGFKSVLDNFRLFFLIFATLLGVGLVAMGVASVANMGFIKQLYAAMPLFKECSDGSCPMMAADLIKPMMQQHALALAITGAILFLLLLGLFLGYVRVVLDFHDKGNSSIGRLFSCFSRVPTMLIALFLYAIAIIVGLFALIVPGIYVALRLRFFPFFIVDKNAGIFDSLKKSYAVTADQTWDLFALVLAWLALSAPFNLTPVGMIILFPALELSYAFIYRRLLGGAQSF